MLGILLTLLLRLLSIVLEWLGIIRQLKWKDISIDCWSGTLHIRRLELHPSVVTNVLLCTSSNPECSISSFTVCLPWTTPFSRPTLVSIGHIRAVLSLSEKSAILFEKLASEEKSSDDISDWKTAVKDCKRISVHSLAFWKRWMVQMLSNISIEVSDISLILRQRMFDDEITMKFELGKMESRSCNSDFDETFSNPTEPFYRNLRISDVSLGVQRRRIDDALSSPNGGKREDETEIISPWSCRVNFLLNPFESSPSLPMLGVFLSSDSIVRISLHESFSTLLCEIIHFFGGGYARPKQAPMLAPKLWWRYALRSVRKRRHSRHEPSPKHTRRKRQIYQFDEKDNVKLRLGVRGMLGVSLTLLDIIDLEVSGIRASGELSVHRRRAIARATVGVAALHVKQRRAIAGKGGGGQDAVCVDDENDELGSDLWLNLESFSIDCRLHQHDNATTLLHAFARLGQLNAFLDDRILSQLVRHVVPRLPPIAFWAPKTLSTASTSSHSGAAAAIGVELSFILKRASMELLNDGKKFADLVALGVALDAQTNVQTSAIELTAGIQYFVLRDQSAGSEIYSELVELGDGSRSEFQADIFDSMADDALTVSLQSPLRPDVSSKARMDVTICELEITVRLRPIMTLVVFCTEMLVRAMQPLFVLLRDAEQSERPEAATSTPPPLTIKLVAKEPVLRIPVSSIGRRVQIVLIQTIEAHLFGLASCPGTSSEAAATGFERFMDTVRLKERILHDQMQRSDVESGGGHELHPFSFSEDVAVHLHTIRMWSCIDAGFRSGGSGWRHHLKDDDAKAMVCVDKALLRIGQLLHVEEPPVMALFVPRLSASVTQHQFADILHTCLYGFNEPPYFNLDLIYDLPESPTTTITRFYAAINSATMTFLDDSPRLSSWCEISMADMYVVVRVIQDGSITLSLNISRSRLTELRRSEIRLAVVSLGPDPPAAVIGVLADADGNASVSIEVGNPDVNLGAHVLLALADFVAEPFLVAPEAPKYWIPSLVTVELTIDGLLARVEPRDLVSGKLPPPPLLNGAPQLCVQVGSIAIELSTLTPEARDAVEHKFNASLDDLKMQFRTIETEKPDSSFVTDSADVHEEEMMTSDLVRLPNADLQALVRSEPEPPHDLLHVNADINVISVNVSTQDVSEFINVIERVTAEIEHVRLPFNNFAESEHATAALKLHRELMHRIERDHQDSAVVVPAQIFLTESISIAPLIGREPPTTASRRRRHRRQTLHCLPVRKSVSVASYDVRHRPLEQRAPAFASRSFQILAGDNCNDVEEEAAAALLSGRALSASVHIRVKMVELRVLSHYLGYIGFMSSLSAASLSLNIGMVASTATPNGPSDDQQHHLPLTLQGSASATVAASFLNRSKQIFQELMAPYPIQIDLDRLTLSISSPSPSLQFTLSPELGELLVDFYCTKKHDSISLSTPSSKKTLQLHNRCGQPVSFRVVSDDEDRGVDNESMREMSCCEHVADGQHFNARVVATSIFVIVTFDDDVDPVSTPPLLVLHPGVYATEVVTSSGTVHALRWEVLRSGVAGNNTVVVFESSFTIVDYTSSSFKLKVSFGRQGRNEVVERVLLPRQPVRLPLLSSSTSMLQVRPHDLPFGFGTSILFSELNDLDNNADADAAATDDNDNGAERIYECPSIGGKRSPLALRMRLRGKLDLKSRGRCVTIGRDAVRGRRRHRGSTKQSTALNDAAVVGNMWRTRVIELRAVVELQNTLPRPLLVRVHSKAPAPALQRSPRVQDALLAPGETMHLFERKSNKLRAQFRFGETFEWSTPPLKLKTMRGGDKHTYKASLALVPQQSRARRSSLVNVVASRKASRREPPREESFLDVCVETHGRRVCVYVDMWLVDNSGFKLVYKLGDHHVHRVHSEKLGGSGTASMLADATNAIESSSQSSSDGDGRWSAAEKSGDDEVERSVTAAKNMTKSIGGNPAFDAVRAALVSDEAEFLAQLDENDNALERQRQRFRRVSLEMLSYHHRRKPKLALSCDGGRKFSPAFDAFELAASSQLAVPQADRGVSMLALSVRKAAPPFHHARIVLIQPKILLHNALPDYTLLVRQQRVQGSGDGSGQAPIFDSSDSEDDDDNDEDGNYECKLEDAFVTHLPPGSRRHFHLAYDTIGGVCVELKVIAPHTHSVDDDSIESNDHFVASKSIWSGALRIDELGTGSVQMRGTEAQSDATTTASTFVICTETRSKEGSLIVRFTSGHEVGAFRIENHTSVPLHFNQSSWSREQQRLSPFSSCVYAWTHPLHEHRLELRSAVDGTELVPAGVDLDEVKEHGSVQLSMPKSASFDCIAMYRAPRLGYQWSKRELLLRHNMLYVYELRRDSNLTRQLVGEIDLDDADVDVSMRGGGEQQEEPMKAVTVDPVGAREWALRVIKHAHEQDVSGSRICVVDTSGETHEIEVDERDVFDTLAARLMESSRECLQERGGASKRKSSAKQQRRWWTMNVSARESESVAPQIESLTFTIELRIEGDVRALHICETTTTTTTTTTNTRQRSSRALQLLPDINSIDVELVMNAFEVLVIDHEDSELVSAFIGGLRLSTVTSDDLKRHRIELQIATLQIDNMLEDARFNVLLAIHGDKLVHRKALHNSGRPQLPALADEEKEQGQDAQEAVHSDIGDDRAGDGREHALHILCVVSVAGEGVICFDVLSVRFREILVYADELLLAKFLVLISNILDDADAGAWLSGIEARNQFWDRIVDGVESAADNDDNSSNKNVEKTCRGSIHEREGEGAAVQLYFKLLALHCIDASISLRTTFNDDDADVVAFRQLVHVTLPEMDKAHLSLSKFVVENFLDSSQALTALLSQHYFIQVLMEAYKVLGAVNMLGNPLGLVKSLHTALSSFVTEPLLGLKKGPASFVEGLAKGTTALVVGSIGGIANSTGHVVGGVADSVSVFAFDNKFRKKRLMLLDSAVERGHLKVGVIRLGQGVLDGVVGVIKKPMEGAAESGVRGLVKGIGRGIIGAAIKPVTGVADFASQTARALTTKNENFASLKHISKKKEKKEELMNQRNSRGWPQGRPSRSRAFSRRSADGQALLLRIAMASNHNVVLDEAELYIRHWNLGFITPGSLNVGGVGDGGGPMMRRRMKKVHALLLLSSLRAVMVEQKTLAPLQHTFVREITSSAVFPMDKHAILVRCKGDDEQSVWNCGTELVASQFAAALLELMDNVS